MQTHATPGSDRATDEGRYELVHVLARGGQGDVWRARDTLLGREVALKLLNESAAHNAELVERLRRERSALVALEGTCAVRIVEGPPDHNGAPCVAMELLDGVDLESRLGELEEKGTRLSFVEVTQVLEPLVQTLHRAHGLGIVHRDLKPANVFLLRDGGVRLIDFGFVRLEFESRMTAFGVVMGSPCYIAPEVWLGHANTSGVSVDIYSLAVMAFRMLGGAPPFETKSLVEMRELATRAARPSLYQLRPDLSEMIDEWVDRALAVDPARRYPTIRSMWEALCEVVHQPKPKSWSIIPRSVAASLHPKRVAETLRRAGAVLWGRTPARDSDPGRVSDVSAAPAIPTRDLLVPDGIGFPRPPPFERPPRPPVRPFTPPPDEPGSEVAPISVVPISVAPISVAPISSGPRSSKHVPAQRAHANVSANIRERSSKRKKSKRKKQNQRAPRARHAKHKVRSKKRR